MALKFFGSVTKLEAALAAAENVINPVLEKAGIHSLKVGGKDVSTSEAPLASRIEAVLALAAPGDHAQTVNELTVTNAELATRNEKLSGDLATSIATVGGLQLEAQALTARAEAAEGSVSVLTAERGQLGVQLKAAQDEYQRVSREQSALNTEISKGCIAIGCLQLTENGVAVPLNASEEKKLSVANQIPASDKFKAYQGGLNQAMSKAGLNVSSLPGSPLTFTMTTPKGIIADYNAAKAESPLAGVVFYRAHQDELDAAFRAARAK